jgi:hypothetical protein
MKQIQECGCEQREDNYMFFQNLKTIHQAVGELLQMDPAHVDKLLSNGHAWAVDHITTSTDDVEEVYHFLHNAMGHEESADSYNSQQPQFVPVGFKNHLKQVMGERIEHRDGKWLVKPKTGDHVLGTHPTKKAAMKQLAAIEISKHKK